MMPPVVLLSLKNFGSSEGKTLCLLAPGRVSLGFFALGAGVYSWVYRLLGVYSLALFASYAIHFSPSTRQLQ